MIKSRLMREIKDLNKYEEFSVEVLNDNIMTWEVKFNGPADSPYEGGIFKLSITFTNNYPYKPPQVTFLTKMFHPNIGNVGNICLDILDSNWSPALKMDKLIISIISLLTDPNANDPLNSPAAKLYKSNKDEYDDKVREMTKQYAK